MITIEELDLILKTVEYSQDKLDEAIATMAKGK